MRRNSLGRTFFRYNIVYVYIYNIQEYITSIYICIFATYSNIYIYIYIENAHATPPHLDVF